MGILMTNVNFPFVYVFQNHLLKHILLLSGIVGAQPVAASCDRKQTETEGSHLQARAFPWPPWIQRSAVCAAQAQI